MSTATVEIKLTYGRGTDIPRVGAKTTMHRGTESRPGVLLAVTVNRRRPRRYNPATGVPNGWDYDVTELWQVL